MPERPNKSVWQGPCGAGPNGGITVSMFKKFLSCRQRFKAHAIEGWRAAPRFDHKLFFGSCWHAAEEGYAANGDLAAIDYATMYAEQESDTFPENREDIRKWWNVVRVTFPEYVKFWSQQPPTTVHTRLLQEQNFDVPYRLPSGRVVRLRGRWDGVTRDPQGQVWLFETKTKGDVDALQVEKQLRFDVQTMTYLVALNGAKFHHHYDLSPDAETGGVRYNVVRRPLSGGKGTIVRHKPTAKNPAGESESDYYERLRQYITDDPASYFFRWTVDVTSADVQVFRTQFLDPCLEFLCAWYDVTSRLSLDGHYHFNLPTVAMTWRTPYGLTGQIQDGYGSDLDRLIEEGSSIGLQRVTDLFPELK